MGTPIVYYPLCNHHKHPAGTSVISSQKRSVISVSHFSIGVYEKIYFKS